jgi:hypothetical protein
MPPNAEERATNVRKEETIKIALDRKNGFMVGNYARLPGLESFELWWLNLVGPFHPKETLRCVM